MTASKRYRNHWNFSILSIIDGKSPKLLERDDIVKQLNDFDMTVDNQKKQIQQLREALWQSMRFDWPSHSGCACYLDGFDTSGINKNNCHVIALAINESGGNL